MTKTPISTSTLQRDWYARFQIALALKASGK